MALVECVGSGAVPRAARWVSPAGKAPKLYGECPSCHRMIRVVRGAEIMAHRIRAKAQGPAK